MSYSTSVPECSLGLISAPQVKKFSYIISPIKKITTVFALEVMVSIVVMVVETMVVGSEDGGSGPLTLDSEQIKESGLVISVACCLSTLGHYSFRP